MSTRISPADISFSGPQAIVRLSAITENWRALDALAPGAETGAVVKANAYGLGSADVSRALFHTGCKTFFTAYVYEALEIRNLLGARPDIYAFHGIDSANIADCISARITPVLNSLTQLQLWKAAGAPAPAAIQIDTGMNRLGLQSDELDTAAELTSGMEICCVMSHLACADTPEHSLNKVQLTRFRDASRYWPEARKSLSNTAGICLGPDYAFDLTRPGIGLYGGYSAPSFPTPACVITLSAPLLSTFTAQEDSHARTSVGYGASAYVSAGTRLGAVSIGYADALPRSMSGKGVGYIRGAACPIIGRVSMDLVTLDLTNAPDHTQPMDRVEFLGLNASLESQAVTAGTLSYELLTSIGPRVRRLYEES